MTGRGGDKGASAAVAVHRIIASALGTNTLVPIVPSQVFLGLYAAFSDLA
jgi:hypothetical protein